MTSEGTCRLVIPLSESTIATAGLLENIVAISVKISFFFSAGKASRLLVKWPKPLFTLTPILSKTSWCFANKSLKKTLTACPKIIGSETFIIVAFICNENNTFCFFASVISVSKKDNNAFLLRVVASIISPAKREIFSFNTVDSPFEAMCSIRTVVGFVTVIDFSLCAKSPAVIVATCVFESDVQTPMECGFFLA